MLWKVNEINTHEVQCSVHASIARWLGDLRELLWRFPTLLGKGEELEALPVHSCLLKPCFFLQPPGPPSRLPLDLGVLQFLP